MFVKNVRRQSHVLSYFYETFVNKKAQSQNCDWVLFLTMAHFEIRHTFLLVKPYSCQECNSDTNNCTNTSDDSDFLFLYHVPISCFLLMYLARFLLVEPIGNYIKNAVPIPLVRNGTAKLQIYFELREGNMLNRSLDAKNHHLWVVGAGLRPILLLDKEFETLHTTRSTLFGSWQIFEG